MLNTNIVIPFRRNNGLVFRITWITLTENVLVLNYKLGLHVYSYYFYKTTISYPLQVDCSNYNTSVGQYYFGLC